MATIVHHGELHGLSYQFSLSSEETCDIQRVLHVWKSWGNRGAGKSPMISFVVSGQGTPRPSSEPDHTENLCAPSTQSQREFTVAQTENLGKFLLSTTKDSQSILDSQGQCGSTWQSPSLPLPRQVKGQRLLDMMNTDKTDLLPG